MGGAPVGVWRGERRGGGLLQVLWLMFSPGVYSWLWHLRVESPEIHSTSCFSWYCSGDIFCRVTELQLLLEVVISDRWGVQLLRMFS